jgi:hypothetical protein
MRLSLFILGWLLGICGFVALMVPVQWLFGRIDGTPSIMIQWTIAAVCLILCAVLLGQYWNRVYGRVR